MTTTLSKIEKSALSECEEIIERNLASFTEAGNALLRIRNERLYRAEFGTFQEYCESKWQMSDRHARRLIDAAEISENLVKTDIMSESSTRLQPLKKLPPAQQQEAWDEAVATAPGGKPTAEHVKLVVEKNLRPPSERINYRPSSGMQYAEMAICNLEKIQPNDKEREAAFDRVAAWLEVNR